jgi:hypothetical protein
MNSIEGRESQKVVIQAIEEYTDRHNANHQAHVEGVNDLRTLQTCNPNSLIQSTYPFKLEFNSSLQTGLSSAQVKINGDKYGVN